MALACSRNEERDRDLRLSNRRRSDPERRIFGLLPTRSTRWPAHLAGRIASSV